MTDARELTTLVRAATEGTPYTVVDQPYGFDLTIDVADASWLTATKGHRLERVFTHEVHVDPAKQRYGITDVDNRVSYSGGLASLTAERSFTRGRVMDYSRRIELGVDAKTGRPGKVVDYTFRAGEGRAIVRRAATAAGWRERMNGEQLGALWVGGVTVVLLVLVFGAIGITALLD